MQIVRVAVWVCVTVFCFWWMLAYPDDPRNKIPFTNIPLAWLALGVTSLHTLRWVMLRKNTGTQPSFEEWRRQREHRHEEDQSVQD